MIDQTFTVIRLTLDYINSVPAHSWYVLGSLLIAGLTTFVAVNVIKNHHLKVKAEALGKKFIQANLFLWGLVTSTAAFIVTNGTDINALAQFAPFLKEYVAPVMVVATFIYTYGGNGVYKAITTKINKWLTEKPVNPTITPVGEGIEEPKKTEEMFT